MPTSDITYRRSCTNLESSIVYIMSRDLIAKYIWIVDTLNRYDRLTRDDLNRLWIRSHLSDGNPMPPRTFFHARRAIEELFHIDINCTPRGEYYIEKGNKHSQAFTNWMLDSAAVTSALQATDATNYIEVEDVPSAREFLPIVIQATKNHEKIKFTYAGFNRSRAEKDIIFHPYLLKLYKQRWYMLGVKEHSEGLRTYALDRIKEMSILNETFERIDTLDCNDVFGNIIGITTSHAPTRTVRLQTTPTQAKYFRALPLHPSQSETVHENYSIFTYQLKINYELVHEIMSLGNAVKVLEPQELRVMVVTSLREALDQYDTP